MSELSEAAVGWQASFSVQARTLGPTFVLSRLLSVAFGAAGAPQPGGWAPLGGLCVAWRCALGLMLSTGKLEAHAAGDGLSRSP